MSERRGLALLLAPYLIGVAVLVIVPGAITFVLSLFDWDLITEARFIGLGNFRELGGDRLFRISILNSLTFAGWAVPLRLAGALALALLLHRRIRGAGTYRAAVWMPTVIPDVAYGLVWLWILNPLHGPLNLLLDSVGLPTRNWLTDPASAQAAIILMSLFTIGEGFLVALATRQELPEEAYELSAVEGAGPWYVFRRVTLPLMGPTLLLLLFRDTVFSLQVTLVPALIVTGGGPPPYATTYLPLFVYQNAFEFLRYGYAAAATVVMFGVTAAIVAIQWVIVRRRRRAFVI